MLRKYSMPQGQFSTIVSQVPGTAQHSDAVPPTRQSGPPCLSSGSQGVLKSVLSVSPMKSSYLTSRQLQKPRRQWPVSPALPPTHHLTTVQHPYEAGLTTVASTSPTPPKGCTCPIGVDPEPTSTLPSYGAGRSELALGVCRLGLERCYCLVCLRVSSTHVCSFDA